MTAIAFEPVARPAPQPRGHGQSTARAATGTAWWLSAILITTLLGFRGTLAKGAAGFDLSHAVHGAMAVGWSVVLIVQASLADARQRTAHRLIATAGIVFAVGLLASSVPMLHTMAGAAVAHAGFRPMGYQLLAMDVLLLVLFVALFAVAIAFVRKPVVHSRALASTGLLALPAGLGRAYMGWAGVDPIGGSHLALLTASVLTFALIVRDRRAQEREPVYPAVLVSLIAMQVLFPLIATAGWFDRATRVFAGA